MITKKFGISKSKYTSYRQCSKLFWLNKNKPEEAYIDESTKARFAAGTEVGKLAQHLFGPFVDASVSDENGNLDLGQMVDRTRTFMEDENVDVICEASFAVNSNYCAVDILKRSSDGWEIYEVKSSTTSKDEFQKDQEKYIPDIAYQKWLLTRCGVNVTASYLVCLDSRYVRHGDLNIQELFTCIQMDEVIEDELSLVESNVDDMQQVLNAPEPEIDIDQQCMKPYQCAFWNYCKRIHGIPEPDTDTNQPRIRSIFELHGSYLYFSEKIKLYRKGIIRPEDALKVKLKKQCMAQINAVLFGTEIIKHDEIRKFLDTLTYPLYFLDFETIQPVVPLYEGTKPYQQIAFQYSLHHIDQEGAELQHTAFLAESDLEDPRRKLAEQLCRDIPMNTCVVAYNKNFECGRIKEMAEAFPDLSEHLLNIQANIKDLWDPFKEWHYYIPAMRGSFSIKSVLPALYPDDPSLNYHNLDDAVQNGGDAMTIFPKIKSMTPENAEKTRAALLEYCKLDTFAMVKVWEKLKEKSL